MIGPFFRKREALIALEIGSVIAVALNIWFNIVYSLETIDSYDWLARLQEPGIQAGEKITHSLYPLVGYPWNVRLAVPCAYGILIVLWSLVIFPLVKIWCFTH